MFAWKAIASACVMAGSLATAAHAATFTELVVFGDSLSDAGNAALITGYNFPPSPPYAGPASNGPTAAQYLAQTYGVTVELGWPAPTASSNNFAVVGGRNGAGNYNVEIQIVQNLQPEAIRLGNLWPTLASTGISAQIARYASQHAAGVPDAASTLFMVWGGPNDMFLGAETFGSVPGVYIPAALYDLAGDIKLLAGMGAQHILVPSMPDLGLTPEALSAGQATSAGLSWLSALYNDGMDAVLAQLGSVLGPLGVQLYGFDTPAFFADLTLNAANYGFTNTTQSCFDRKTVPLDFTNVLGGCEGFLYFDNVHPTTAAHKLLAGGFAQAVPEPSTYALMMLGLAAIGVMARRRHRG